MSSFDQKLDYNETHTHPNKWLDRNHVPRKVHAVVNDKPHLGRGGWGGTNFTTPCYILSNVQTSTNSLRTGSSHCWLFSSARAPLRPTKEAVTLSLTKKPDRKPPKAAAAPKPRPPLLAERPRKAPQRRGQRRPEDGREPLGEVPVPRLLAEDPAVPLQHVEPEEVEGHERRRSVESAVQVEGGAYNRRHGGQHGERQVARPAAEG